MKAEFWVDGIRYAAAFIDNRFVLCLPEKDFPGVDSKVVLYSFQKVQKALRENPAKT